MKLTDRSIKSLKPSDKDQFISDGGGLYIRIKPSGTKTFLIRTTNNGKSRWVTIGDYPHLSLLDARRKLDRHSDSVITVREVYRKFDKSVLSNYACPETPRAKFNKDVLPKIGDMAITAVTRADLFKVLQPILDRGSKVAANRTLTDLKHLFQFAEERGYIDEDPSAKVTRKSCGGREVPKDRALSFDEIRGFLQARLDDLRNNRGMGVTTVAAMYICLLTALRASEALWIMGNWKPGMKTITSPGHVTKSKRPHTVPLSRQTRAVLKLCFGLPLPSSHTVLSHALRRIGVDFTPHDFRRTLATRASDMGVAPHVIEKLLDHKMTGVMAVYNRAEYLPEQAAALEMWGRKIAELRRKKAPT